MKKRLSVFAMLLFSASLAQAQRELTLDEAVNYALKHKSDALKADLDVTNSEHRIAEVRASALPQINGSAGLTYNAKLQQMAMNMGGQTMVIRMGQPWQSTAALQLDQQIFNMSLFQGLKAARSTREFYQINATLTKEQIVEKVANAYYELFKTKSQIKTLDKTVANTTRVKNIISSLEQNGLAKKIDLDRISVSLNNLNSNRIQLGVGLQLQENALKYLIGMPIEEAVTLPESTFDAPTQMYAQEPVDISNRTEVKLMEQQGTLLRLNKKATEASRYPTLGFSANYGYLALGTQFPYFHGGSPNVNGSDFSALSLNLRVPIFNGFATRSKIRQAQIEIDKFEADFADTRLALNLAAQNAQAQINNSIITLNSQKSNMELAKQVLDNVENNYKNGLASLTDLMDAETSNASAQNNYTAALLDYKLAEIQLKKANGSLISSYSNSNKQ